MVKTFFQDIFLFLLYIELSLKPFKFSRQVEERSREQINEDSEEEEEDTVNNVALASTTSTEVDAQAIEVKILFCLFSDTYLNLKFGAIIIGQSYRLLALKFKHMHQQRMR